MSSKAKEVKTNAMRILSQAGIPYRTSAYEVDETDLSGVHAAQLLGVPPEQMFKTLVTKGEKRGYLVFCIPVAEELDLKKCAQAAGDKSVRMLPVKELFPLTGYVRGGCSPLGMKKQFPTFFDETAVLYDEIYVSAGMRGVQILAAPEPLAEFLGASFAELTKK
ncbi:MAG: Cys-tRNA(Pro) deacylase [Lachnospiraceae bacterium]|nr:Cys-tRNA(Pro) deacylase [Lachnospiraceae bacterium]